MTYRWIFGMAVMALWICGCSGPTVTVPYTIETVDMIMEGPLFEGPNSASLTHTPDFSVVSTDSLPVSADRIKGARLVSATLYAADSMTFDDWSSATLQLVSDDADMVEMAVVNPVPDGATTLSFNVSEEAEADDFFTAPSFTIVVDGSLKEDWYDNYYFTATFTFELAVKP